MQKVCVIGLGYIGLPLALLLSKYPYFVYGYDVDDYRVTLINNEISPISEKGIDKKLLYAIQHRKLIASTEVNESDIYIIAVPTPLDYSFESDQYTPNVSYVFSAIRAIKKYLKKDDLVIIESTCPVGTTERIAEELASSIRVAYCPERVLPGNIFYELKNNDRVVGGINEESTKAAYQFYRSFCEGNIHKTNSKTAEFVKLIENASRDVNIALANEIEALAKEHEVNPIEAIALANKHPRVNILNPGIGVGGHCIPIDPVFLSYNSCNARILNVARNINKQKEHVVAKQILEDIEKLDCKSIAILGMTYKANVSDFRNSPATNIALEIISKYSGVVLIQDPFINEEELEDILDSVDYTVCLVKHSQYEDLVLDKGEYYVH